MKGVSYIVSDKNERTDVIIDISLFQKGKGKLRELFAALIAESRKDDAKVPLSKIIRKMKKKGKLT